MSQEKWITTASLSGLIQSLMWIGLSITGALVYLCAIPVPPYAATADFFRVTFVKLYFEGPRSKLNGDYLGKFNNDYRNPDKIDLLTPDIVFAIMIAYFILNVIYFFSSYSLYSNRKVQTNDVNKLVNTSRIWSCLTLAICALDAFLTAKLISDIYSLWTYMAAEEEETKKIVSAANSKIQGIPYISLLFALISSRFIAIWLWNVIVGGIFLFNCKCLKKAPEPEMVEVETKIEVAEKTDLDVEKVNADEKQKNTEELPKPKIPNFSRPEWERYPYSIQGYNNFHEKVTSFREEPYPNYPAKKEGAWYPPSVTRYGKRNEDWGMINDAYIDEEQAQFEEPVDFDHNLKNFEQGRKPRTMKPPIGKPVSIPVPPPLPNSESYNC